MIKRIRREAKDIAGFGIAVLIAARWVILPVLSEKFIGLVF